MAKTKNKPARLGRGLSALLTQPVAVPNESQDPAQHDEKNTSSPNAETKNKGSENNAASLQPTRDTGIPGDSANKNPFIQFIPVNQITPNPNQPRQIFEEKALQSLAQSIASEGVMQPIIVCPTEKGTFQLVAGERRWRASQQAGLKKIPAVVRQLDDQQVAQWSLIENLQREDLNPIERAQAFERLIQQFNLSHEQVAQHVSVQRSTVTNSLRLLKLAEEVQQMLVDGLLSNGQAKTLAAIPYHDQQISLAAEAIRKGLNVRQLEKKVRDIQAHAISDQSGNQPDHTDADALQDTRRATPGRRVHLTDLEQQIAQQIGTRVKIKPGRKKGTGTLQLNFSSLDEFDRIIARLGITLDP